VDATIRDQRDIPSKEGKGVGPTRGAPCTSRTLVAGTYMYASAYMQLAEEQAGRGGIEEPNEGWKEAMPPRLAAAATAA